ncbi:hypothetical protein AeNC1_000131 [Aphanomyces euteiches]|nr:hypothetical protein AeNC1_000131 [Aphanomyces euteiches]
MNPMTTTKTTTRESTGCGFVFGFVLLAIGLFFLFMNEGNAVRQHTALEEGLALVVEYESEEKRSFESILVHMAGRLTTQNDRESPIVVDAEFGIAARGVYLHRIVEMLQWEEVRHVHTYTENGQEKTDTTYSYKKTWSAERIDSDRFDDASYVNPVRWAYTSKKIPAPSVYLQKHRVPPSLLDKIKTRSDVSLGRDNLLQMASILELQFGIKQEIQAIPALKQFNIDHDQFISRRTKWPSDRASIGDMRIRFELSPAAAVSVVAMPFDSELHPYRTKNGESVALLEEGIVDAKTMFENERSNVTTMTWVVRLIGLVIVSLGYYILLQPVVDIAHMFSGVPLLGQFIITIVSRSVEVMSGLLGLSTTLIVIAIAWVYYRPLVAFGLFVVAITPYFGMRKKPAKSEI